jgi:hypothetical protein
MHELRASTLTMPGEGIVLPPLYYGTVDATALWICLFAETAQRMPDADVIALLPAMEAALDWIVASAERTGFLEYVDETGHGLSNQGWKDSGDSIQWQDGSLAAGPIALCEVQGYAYEAAIGGADLLERFGRPGAERAARVGARSRSLRGALLGDDAVRTFPRDRPRPRGPRGRHAHLQHRPSPGHRHPGPRAGGERRRPADRSADGVRLRHPHPSTDAGGYWPLSYHGGSVWIHDTAIVARGCCAGRHDHARRIVAQMLAGAEAFEFRVPELYAGDSADEVRAPAPTPRRAGRRPGRPPRPSPPGRCCGPTERAQSTALTVPPVRRTSSSNVRGNTVCGVPPAAQISSNAASASSTTVVSGAGCPVGATPPIAWPVAVRT